MALRIVLTGSTGLIGSTLMRTFLAEGHSVVPIVRSSTPIKANHKVIRWNIDYEKIDPAELEGCDVVIHLAGANIAAERWSARYKKVMLESRVRSTAFLSKTLAHLKKPPRILLCASAVGYYGHGPADEKKDEASPKGTGFLAELCAQWEQATQPAVFKGIRVICMRFGMVLSKSGGALGKMLPIFKLGLGGKLGCGRQMMSWIALDEIPRLVLHTIHCEKLSGAVNFVSPEAVVNEEFTRTLGRVIRRPAIFPVPSLAVKLLFGEMGDSLLLGGAHVVPRKILESGYPFAYPHLEGALQKILL